jgi:acetyl/propionyl-CoA carboxylase alpha subunit/acetyl-CoA carboxylase carboxyltransferase component
MNIRKLLIANRGEIAVRIARAAADLAIHTAAIYPADDATSLHVLMAEDAHLLEGRGPSAYMDINQIVRIAAESGCDAVHPGYGFLSEDAGFASACSAAGLTFIGPAPTTLELLGDKARARALAAGCGVPVLPGTAGATSLEDTRAFYKSLGKDAAVMVKALRGGGGRGIRAVHKLADLDIAYERCRSEAAAAFGHGDVYIEQCMPLSRHIEVQVAGDGRNVVHLGERDCTLQRRNQKIVEIAPSPALSQSLRNKLTSAALKIAAECKYINLGTFEFLVEYIDGKLGKFAFMEANPRLQVEHTVTEEAHGIDLVRLQVELAGGRSLQELGMRSIKSSPKLYSLQMRLNAEGMDTGGNPVPAAGSITVFEAPTGPGVRVDTCAYSGYTVNQAYDSLLAKLVVTSRSKDFVAAVQKAARALGELRIEGVETNRRFLLALLSRPEVEQDLLHTRFVEDKAGELTAATGNAGCIIRRKEPSVTAEPGRKVQYVPPGTIPVPAPMQGCVADIEVSEGDAVVSGQKLVVLESMKMEHVIHAEVGGYVRKICVAVKDIVSAGAPLLFIEQAEITADTNAREQEIDLDSLRHDLSAVIERHAFTLDSNRPEAVARRRKGGRRTARENVEDLCDPGSFIEYGALIIAAQRSRRSVDDLIKRTPADGLIAGIGTVNRDTAGEERARCMVLAYDYTVLAGTQGLMNHRKMDRMLHIANQWKLPTVLFAEGGGGRPGDVDAPWVAGLDLTTFSRFGALSGKAPVVGIVEGPCFAGNAALLGCCDVIIATRNSNIGMGGPAMIEGGGLGVVRPEEIGPIDIQTRNGVVDIAVENEAAATAVAKNYLSYFQGALTGWEAGDQRLLRWLIPENRLRVYDVRRIIETLADKGTFLELRRGFGAGMVTALIRIEGRPLGLIANDSRHMGGAIEAEDADKAARFMQLCNVHRLPILSLCDTPGFMVGPEIEERAQVRHVCRMFVVGSHVSVPFFTVVLRKGYGLGAMAMAAGGFHDSFFTTSWPTGEFGGMGLEGAVRHGFRKELEAIKDPEQRESTYNFFVEQAYAMGKAVNMASFMEIDSVIDPAETRQWIMRGLNSAPAWFKDTNTREFIDPW